ncbi:MAG: hypothetical protein AAF518_27980, partial [Spirochaetota bacterium]
KNFSVDLHRSEQVVIWRVDQKRPFIGLLEENEYSLLQLVMDRRTISIQDLCSKLLQQSPYIDPPTLLPHCIQMGWIKTLGV